MILTGIVTVRAGSRIATSGMSDGAKMIVFLFVSSSVTSPARPTSLPVPAVVGTAISGAIGLVILASPPIASSYWLSGGEWVAATLTILATSKLLPPPTATKRSAPDDLKASVAAQTSFSERVRADLGKRRVLDVDGIEGRLHRLEQTGFGDADVAHDERTPASGGSSTESFGLRANFGHRPFTEEDACGKAPNSGHRTCLRSESDRTGPDAYSLSRVFANTAARVMAGTVVMTRKLLGSLWPSHECVDRSVYADGAAHDVSYRGDDR